MNGWPRGINVIVTKRQRHEEKSNFYLLLRFLRRFVFFYFVFLFKSAWRIRSLRLIDDLKIGPTATVYPNAAAINAPGTAAHTTRIAALTDQLHLSTNPFSAPMPPKIARFAINSVRTAVITIPPTATPLSHNTH
jgi:hypothetical protein